MNKVASKVDKETQIDDVLLEAPQVFSQSKIWDIQRAYYFHKGVDAWSGDVPFFVTSNCYIAHNYAKMVFAFMQDWRRQNPDGLNETFYILELGAGSGQLSFYVLRHLRELVKQEGLTDELKYCYVMSDFSTNNVNFWRQHAAFQSFYEEGTLDAVQFNMEEEQSLELMVSGKTLDEKTIKTPLVVFANYIFDTVVSDAFSVQNNKLTELRIRLETPKENTRDDHFIVEDIKKIKFYASLHDIDIDSYYDDPALNQLLQYYQDNLQSAQMLIPSSSIRCIRHLMKLASNQVLLLSSDKAFNLLEQLEGKNSTGLAYHGNGFSLMVNYDAIGRYFEYHGGQSFRPATRDNLTTIACNVGFDLQDMPRLRGALYECIEAMCPSDYHALFNNHVRNVDHLTFDGLVAFLRLSHWDPYVFNGVVKGIVAKFKESTPMMRRLLEEGLPKVLDNYYQMPCTAGTYFNIGICYHLMQKLHRAIDFYELSNEIVGPSYRATLNIGHCYGVLGFKEKGERYKKEAEQYKPSQPVAENQQDKAA